MTECTTDDGSASATDATLQVIDRQALLERCMGEASAASALLSMFQDRLPQIVAEISAGLADRQTIPETLRKVHTLKGNAGNLAADRLYCVASLLEATVRRAELTNVPPLLQDLQREADALLCAIPAVLETFS
jgi:HPt (histidine-containing phosphotransfer) domain-containing protein